MRKIAINVHNGLLEECIDRVLNESDEFQSYRIPMEKRSGLVTECRQFGAEILLLEATTLFTKAPMTRMDDIRRLRKENPQCKIALLCDENTVPDIARKAVAAKKDGVIDVFFYTSVESSYLVAMLAAL